MFRSLVFAAAAVAALSTMPVHAQSSDAAARSTPPGPEPAVRRRMGARAGRIAGKRELQGDNRFNDRWTDFSLAAIAKRQDEDRAALAKLHAIDRKGLAPADQLNYDTFEWELERNIERQQFQEYLQPVSHQGGVQTADGLAELLPFASTKDYRDWLKRMEAVPTLVEQSIALMKEGVRAGNMPPKVLMQRVPAQIAAQIVEDPTKSPFYRPFLNSTTRSRRRSRALQAEAQRIVRDRLVPAYRQLADLFRRRLPAQVA